MTAMIPRSTEPLWVGNAVSRPWYAYLRALEQPAGATATELAAAIERIVALENAGGAIGTYSISGRGNLSLVGDTDAPGASYFYGTAADGQKGWQALGDALAAGDGVTKTVDADTGVVTFAHADTSSVTDLASDNAGGVVLQDIAVTFDTFGHVQTLTVGTVDLDARYALIGSTGGGDPFAGQPLTDQSGNAFTDQLGNPLTTRGKTTSDLPEGTNLYFTDARAQSANAAALAGKFDKTGGTVTGPVTVLHGSGADLGLILGSSATDATTKDTRLLLKHYTAAEEGIALLGASSFGTYNPSFLGVGGNQVRFGGGFGVQNSATNVLFYTADTTTTLGGTLRWGILGSGGLLPGADNAYNFGEAAKRVKEIFCANSVINTSDAREKTALTPLTPNELNAAADLAAAIGSFQWLESVARKGAAARVHVGLTVQRAIEVMRARGLDPLRYGLICYDEWEAQPEVWDEWGDEYDAAGNLVRAAGRELAQAAIPAGNRYGFRHDQLLLFVMRGMAQRQAAIETRLQTLERGLTPQKT